MDNKSLDAQAKTLYVGGLLMDYQMDRFLLINKNGMKLKDGTIMFWQGIGGHINSPFEVDTGTGTNMSVKAETPHEAMEREFKEETGKEVKRNRWHCYHIKDYGATKIYFFVAFGSPNELIAAESDWGEEGQVKTHTLVDILFDTRQYTFDLPYLINIIIREMRAGGLYKLDPEGVNARGKDT